MLPHRKKQLLATLNKEIRMLQVKRIFLSEECQKQKGRVDELRAKAVKEKAL